MTILRRTAVAVILLATCASVTACGDDKETRIEQAIAEDVKAVAGVARVTPSVNANTSGTFITVKVTADGSDRPDMERILNDSLVSVLRDPRVGDGVFAMSVFSPDDATSVGPGDLGYTGTATTSDLRKFFG
jgi:hypothetical protein